MTLEPGTYSVGWFAVDDRDEVIADAVSAEARGPVTFAPPFDGGPAVLLLTRG